MKSLLTYLSHGAYETGGYAHENMFASNLAISCNLNYANTRFRKEYKGFLNWFLLSLKAFKNASSTITVTVSRLIWPVVLRNLFTKNKVVLVLHNRDINDGKPWFYYPLLDAGIRFASKFLKHRFILVCISTYWEKTFKELYPKNLNIQVFPNLFEIEKYQFYKDIAIKKPNLVHLGMWSDKIDKKQYQMLLFALKAKGYEAYFSSSIPVDNTDFPILVFNSTESYLKQMALSKATVIMNKIVEGWPRLVHESFLVGTTVITTNKESIEPLILLGNGHFCNNAKEVLSLLENLPALIHSDGLMPFHINNLATFLNPITNLCLA